MDVIKHIIKHKHKASNKYYKKRFKDEPSGIYLYYYDIMNVYPLFPTPIDMKLEQKYKFDLMSSINSKKYDLTKKKDPILDELVSKIREIHSVSEEEIQTRTRGMVRKFFSYEIIDKLKEEYGAEYVTNAWLKCYEIVNYFSMLDNVKDDSTVEYFGICEQPGAFVYALNHYATTHLGKKFNFVIESLIDPSDKKIFKAEYKLYNKYIMNYDYGKTGTGDVTKTENLKYYRDKYKNRKFHIITADCGMDCSADFAEQERNLMVVVVGQFLLAISLAKKGTNYFYKLFTMYERVTQELIYLAQLLFEEVSICRALTTKPESGENYIVCKNFKGISDQELDMLYGWYDEFKKDGIFLLKENIIDKNFLQFIDSSNDLLAQRRITSINFLLFRFYNASYAKKSEASKEIYKYINDLVEHYTKYFIEYCKIKKLDEKNRLI